MNHHAIHAHAHVHTHASHTQTYAFLTPTLRRQEERKLQRAAGINSFGDMAALLASAPRDLVELLRVNTVIRGVANQLVGGAEAWPDLI